jgi:hypothetical protein
MGMGYIESNELGMSRAEFKKLYSEWETKLKESGFNDIEYRSPSHTGHFTPFFRSNGSTATFMRMYDPAKEEYYSLCRDFDSYMYEVPEGSRVSRWTLAFPGKSKTYKLLWYYHIEGVPYRGVAAAFSNTPNKYLRNLKKVPKHLIRARSEFWTHDHTHKILDLFWAWAKVHKGFEDPRSTAIESKDSQRSSDNVKEE